VLLLPGKAALRPEDPDRERVLLADADLRRGERPGRAVLQLEEDHAVVVERPARDPRSEHREQRLDARAGDVLGEVRRVRPDVPHRAARTGELRIDAPARLLLSGRFELVAEPALEVLDVDLADLAELARLHEVRRLAHHRVAGVVVRDAE